MQCRSCGICLTVSIGVYMLGSKGTLLWPDIKHQHKLHILVPGQGSQGSIAGVQVSAWTAGGDKLCKAQPLICKHKPAEAPQGVMPNCRGTPAAALAPFSPLPLRAGSRDGLSAGLSAASSSCTRGAAVLKRTMSVTSRGSTVSLSIGNPR